MEEPKAAMLKQIKDGSDAFNIVIYIYVQRMAWKCQGSSPLHRRELVPPQRQMMSTQRQGQKRRRKLPASHESSPC